MSKKSVYNVVRANLTSSDVGEVLLCFRAVVDLISSVVWRDKRFIIFSCFIHCSNMKMLQLQLCEFMKCVFTCNVLCHKLFCFISSQCFKAGSLNHDVYVLFCFVF